MRKGLLIVAGVLALVIIGGSIRRQHKLASTFDQSRIGESEAVVLSQFGKPWKVGKCGQIIGGDAREHCAKEYLYASPYAPLRPEYWAMRFDENGRLIEKYRYVSP